MVLLMSKNTGFEPREYAGGTLKASDAAQPMGCSPGFVPQLVSNWVLRRMHIKKKATT